MRIRSLPPAFSKIGGNQLLTRFVLIFFALGAYAQEADQARRFLHFSGNEGAPVNETVLQIIQDKQGMMWFATSGGLYSFDSRKFRKFAHDPRLPGSLPTKYVETVICDSHGTIWAGSTNGLCRHDKATGKFQIFRHDPNDETTISGNNVRVIVEDTQRGLWLGAGNGLNYLTDIGKSINVRRFVLPDANGDALKVWSIAEDRNRILWIGTTSGLFRMNKDGSNLRRYDNLSGDAKPASNDINLVHIDRKNRIWVGTRNGGLYRFDAASGKFQLIPEFRTKNNIFPPVTRILDDGDEGLWIGTGLGLAKYDIRSRSSIWYTRKFDDPGSLADNSVYAICIDNQGGMWLGSYYTGIDYTSASATPFSVVPFSRGEEEKVPLDVYKIGKAKTLGMWVVTEDRSKMMLLGQGVRGKSVFRFPWQSASSFSSFHLDSLGTIWAGGDGVLRNFNPKSGKIKDYLLKPAQSSTLIKERIRTIREDGLGGFWLAGDYGLIHFNGRSLLFSEVYTTRGESLSASHYAIKSVLEDSRHNLWIGGANCIFVRKAGTSAFKPVSLAPNTNPAQSAVVNFIREDRLGRIWFAASEGGLQVFDPKRGSATRIFKNRDMAENAYNILVDNDLGIWIGQEGGGLTRYHPDDGTSQHFNQLDGLPSDVIKASTSFQDDDGTMFFGTNNGVFKFQPKGIKVNKDVPPLVFSGLKLFNNDVEPGDHNRILSRPLTTSEKIVFEHTQNVFTIDFALLSYARRDKNRYAYMMEGFEKNWNYVDNPSATYTNLNPGDYTLLIKAANSDGYWTQKPARLRITVLPPLWKTWYAYLTYFLVLGGAIFILTRLLWARNVFRKESELYHAKLDFFTNISHEIRTHLTLIGGPIQKVHQSPSLDPQSRKLLSHATNNADRLMDLVNELLNFQKMENGELKLCVREENFVQNLKSTLAAFEHLFTEKRIEISLKFFDADISLWYDRNQMQKVFYNLLSNAHKFTPEGGKVSIEVTDAGQFVAVDVIDNGVGISPQHLEKIFENFFQEFDAANANRGYGIGLALSRKIMELHRGSLTVTSRKSKNNNNETRFHVKLLKGNAHFPEFEISEAPEAFTGHSALPETFVRDKPENNLPLSHKYSILLVEDNAELLAFTREIIENTYKVLEAPNGLIALEIAREHLPDLIVSDIMMPEIDGLNLCTTLKSDVRTCHIPIILLTAKGAPHHLLHGLKAGADAYIVKPFDIRVLELKIKNLLNTRRVLSLRNEGVLGLDTGATALLELDKQFLAKLKKLIDENISDSGFGVRQISEEVGMSLSLLYKKVKAITGMTVNDFVKSIKMRQAAKLLSMKIYNVNEVAYMVGYEDRKYFSKEFKKIYGKSPSKFGAPVLDESFE